MQNEAEFHISVKVGSHSKWQFGLRLVKVRDFETFIDKVARS